MLMKDYIARVAISLGIASIGLIIIVLAHNMLYVYVGLFLMTQSVVFSFLTRNIRPPSKRHVVTS